MARRAHLPPAPGRRRTSRGGPRTHRSLSHDPLRRVVTYRAHARTSCVTSRHWLSTILLAGALRLSFRSHSSVSLSIIQSPFQARVTSHSPQGHQRHPWWRTSTLKGARRHPLTSAHARHASSDRGLLKGAPHELPAAPSLVPSTHVHAAQNALVRAPLSGASPHGACA